MSTVPPPNHSNFAASGIPRTNNVSNNNNNNNIAFGSNKMMIPHPQNLATTIVDPDNILLTAQNRPRAAKPKPKRVGAYSTANMRPSSVARRNARERNRVRQVNNGFTQLRDHLPPVPEDEEVAAQQQKNKDKKISKVETLKRAVDYIKSLQSLLQDHDAMLCSPSGSTTTTTSTTEIQWHQPQAFQFMSMSASSVSSMSPAFSEAASPAASVASSGGDAGSPVRHHPAATCVTTAATPGLCTSFGEEHHQFQDLQQLDPAYEYDDLTPLSADDEELLDAIAWWQQS